MLKHNKFADNERIPSWVNRQRPKHVMGCITQSEYNQGSKTIEQSYYCFLPSKNQTFLLPPTSQWEKKIKSKMSMGFDLLCTKLPLRRKWGHDLSLCTRAIANPNNRMVATTSSNTSSVFTKEPSMTRPNISSDNEIKPSNRESTVNTQSASDSSTTTVAPTSIGRTKNMVCLTEGAVEKRSSLADETTTSFIHNDKEDVLITMTDILSDNNKNGINDFDKKLTTKTQPANDFFATTLAPTTIALTKNLVNVTKSIAPNNSTLSNPPSFSPADHLLNMNIVFFSILIYFFSISIMGMCLLRSVWRFIESIAESRRLERNNDMELATRSENNRDIEREIGNCTSITIDQQQTVTETENKRTSTRPETNLQVPDAMQVQVQVHDVV